MKLLIAPTAFKGTLSPIEAAEALAKGAAEALPEAEIVKMPIGDGGDGTMEVLVSALDGDQFPMSTMGPLGRPVDSAFGWLPGETAVVELASASGLALVPPEKRDAMRATTRGTGDLIAAALERKPRRIIIGVGGSATSDGGAGIAEALWVSLTNGNGAAIGPGALGLTVLEAIDTRARDPSLGGVELVVACDVANPLLGAEGAARVFAPQKGASSLEVEAIERALTRLAELVRRDLGIWLGDMPRAGAAGGAAGGMHALLGAQLRDGFEIVSEALEFEGMLAGADLLIVGEGRLDQQSLSGKAAIAAARMARRLGVPVWVFAGSVDLDPSSLEAEGIEAAVDLTERWGNRALSDPASALRQSAAETLSRRFDL